jgi:hypothetical protein
MAIRKAVVAAKVETPKQTSKPVVAAKVERVRTATENIKAMDFVPVWQKSATTADCAETFGRNEMWASSFASRLRKMGVNLKKMPRAHGMGRTGLDIDELNALIK